MTHTHQAPNPPLVLILVADCRFSHPLGRAIDITGFSGLSNGSRSAPTNETDMATAARREQRFGEQAEAGRGVEPLDGQALAGSQEEPDDIELILPGNVGASQRVPAQPVA